MNELTADTFLLTRWCEAEDAQVLSQQGWTTDPKKWVRIIFSSIALNEPRLQNSTQLKDFKTLPFMPVTNEAVEMSPIFVWEEFTHCKTSVIDLAQV